MTYSNNNGELYQAVEAERHPLRWLWWLLGALILAGLVWGIAHACTRNNEPAIEAQPTPTVAAPVDENAMPIGHVNLDCDGTPVAASIFDGHLIAQISDEQFTLPEAVSADGARYSDGSTTLWQAHDNWELIHNDGAANEQIIQCEEVVN